MHIIVTAGPTREYFDSVRFITNGSSGRMGYAIAAEGSVRGYEVTLISGPVDLGPPPGVNLVNVVSASEMFDASLRAFETADAAIMVAAVCDYRPAEAAVDKRVKGTAPISVELLPTRDICEHLGSIKGSRQVIGFAMEDHDHHEHAERKLARKHCDAIVMNSIDCAGAGGGTIEIFQPGAGWSEPISGSKEALARSVVDLVRVVDM